REGTSCALRGAGRRAVACPAWRAGVGAGRDHPLPGRRHDGLDHRVRLYALQPDGPARDHGLLDEQRDGEPHRHVECGGRLRVRDSPPGGLLPDDVLEQRDDSLPLQRSSNADEGNADRRLRLPAAAASTATAASAPTTSPAAASTPTAASSSATSTPASAA